MRPASSGALTSANAPSLLPRESVSGRIRDGSRLVPCGSPDVGYCGYIGNVPGQRGRRAVTPGTTAVTPDCSSVLQRGWNSRGCNRSNRTRHRRALALTCDVTVVTAVTDFLEVCRGGYASGCTATKVPRPCMTTIKPSSTRLAMARRTVARATPYTSTARSCSAGSRLLAGSTPLRMSVAMSSAICCQTNRGPSCSIRSDRLPHAMRPQ